MPRRFPIAKKRAVACMTVAAVGLVLFLRKPDSLRNPQFYAEDGTVFFIGARQLGLQAFLTPYGGYLHMLPRTIAYAAGFFDPLWTPAVYNGVALCIDVAVVAMLFSQRVRLPAKPVLALALALVPHNGEVFLSLTDLQWLLALALVLLLLTDDAATAAQRWFDRGALALCGLTGPFLCFLSPLFVMRAAVRRTREAATLAVLALLAAALQANYLRLSGPFCPGGAGGPARPVVLHGRPSLRHVLARLRDPKYLARPALDRDRRRRYRPRRLALAPPRRLAVSEGRAGGCVAMPCDPRRDQVPV